MDSHLEYHLRLCYPTGFHRLVAHDQINQQPALVFWEQLQPLLETHGFYCYSDCSEKHVVKFPVYRFGEPSHWFFSDNRTEKIAALKISGIPHVALEFKVSTIMPALFISIQETWFNPKTYGDKAKGKFDDGLLTIGFRHETTFEPWASLMIATRELAQKLALLEFDEKELKEDVSFVTHPIWNDEDDDLEDLSDEEFYEHMKRQPQYVCCLYDCLFGFV
jgi:hypothetical protein